MKVYNDELVTAGDLMKEAYMITRDYYLAQLESLKQSILEKIMLNNQDESIEVTEPVIEEHPIELVKVDENTINPE